MKLWQYGLWTAIVGFGLLDGSSTFAETGPRLSGDRKTSAAQTTGTVLTRNTSYQLNNGESSPFREETVEPPMPPIFGAVATDQESDTEPSAPTTPTTSAPTPADDAMPVPLPGEVPEGGAIDPAYAGVPNDAAYPASTAAGGAGAGGGSYVAGDGNWGYANSGYGNFGWRGLGCRPRCGGITFGGWLDQGVTANNRFPVDRFNGPVAFNDRDGEYQMNQLWVYAEKETNTGGYGWDVGGRVDFMYGTDWRFTSSFGLEDDWNNRRFYGAAMPQLYLDVAFNDLTVRMGHFYTIIGYEVTPAPDNFFYSHTYALQYGEPITHTGLQATYDLTSELAFSGGFNRGWNNWADNNNDLSFLGGATVTSWDKNTSLSLALSTGNYDPAGELNRTMYSLVLAHRSSERFSYVFQYDWGRDENGGLPGFDGGWYGINNELFYTLNREWTLGLRTEWFRDADGTRVGGIGAPHGWTLGPDIADGRIGWAGTFWEMTFGANWTPCENVVVRPECRWDWYDGQPAAGGLAPFNSGRNNSQFLFGTDVVVSF